MKVIIITGTPGTGKSSLAKELSLLTCYTYIDVNKLLKSEDSSFDKKRDSYVFPESKINNRLKSLILTLKRSKNPPKGVILDSHMSHFLKSQHVDLCIVLKADLKILQARLKKRGYAEEKIRENLDSEIFDVCLNESLENGFSSKLVVAFSNQNVKNLAQNLLYLL